MAINRHGKTPLYQQIADWLRAGITRGDYRPGQPLPSESTIMATHHVARLTARKAVRVLAAEGLVEVVQGRGAYVKNAA